MGWLEDAVRNGLIRPDQLPPDMRPAAAERDGRIVRNSLPPPVPSHAAGGGPLVVLLPFPPSVNHYWRRVGNKTMISGRGRAYRKEVGAEVWRQKASLGLAGPLSVSISFVEPDARRRDLDNLPKAVLDALQHAGVYGDDSQVRELNLSFAGREAGGRCVVTILQLRETSR